MWDRIYFGNTRLYGNHGVGKIYLSMHLDSRTVSDANRGPRIVYPMCYDANKKPTTGTCANQAKIDKSILLASKICARLGAHISPCAYFQDQRDLIFLRETANDVPSVVIEYLNLRDSRDANLLTSKNKDQWARDVMNAVIDFYNATLITANRGRSAGIAERPRRAY